MSSEDVTPRITSVFALWHDSAKELSVKLHALEVNLSRDLTRVDRDAADVARGLRIASESFAKLFASWPRGTRSAEQKQLERVAFESFRQGAMVFLEGH